ncbi:hypothetical protein [Gordonia sp. (in: high G+C Gram-positive bacteria)]|uniref:hypothetical protein n=1 Tax=Gordonia sp. (in: high G+C Gram-positive bacteria) TaxID=84139 RepID=UPI00257B1C72|nr:hypothetical protein [Gordonia sp. (in: high G+C Gram-positive bacteria)]
MVDVALGDLVFERANLSAQPLGFPTGAVGDAVSASTAVPVEFVAVRASDGDEDPPIGVDVDLDDFRVRVLVAHANHSFVIGG